eukprot:5916135-Amphidinium_carterae.1
MCCNDILAIRLVGTVRKTNIARLVKVADQNKAKHVQKGLGKDFVFCVTCGALLEQTVVCSSTQSQQGCHL